MAGPYPPPPPGGTGGPPFPGTPAHPAEPYPYPGNYPGPLPPPVAYPAGFAGGPARGRRPILWALLGLGLVGVLVAGALAIGAGRSGRGAPAFTEAAAKTAIQNYLTALTDSDIETVARNNTCGMFDALRDRKSDVALARLASDAFRKQFARAEVTSVDKIVQNSSHQAQALFTMRVEPASTSRKGRDEEQGVAQLLRQDDQLLVCSYLLRTTAQY